MFNLITINLLERLSKYIADRFSANEQLCLCDLIRRNHNAAQKVLQWRCYRLPKQENM